MEVKHPVYHYWDTSDRQNKDLFSVKSNECMTKNYINYKTLSIICVPELLLSNGSKLLAKQPNKNGLVFYFCNVKNGIGVLFRQALHHMQNHYSIVN